MRSIKFTLLAVIVGTLLACGGGGGGTSGGPTTKLPLTGRVVDVATTGALNPAATVSAGGGTDTTDITDGSFSLDADRNTTTITVVPTGTAYGNFTFTTPPIT
jgi:hypothetical protein